MRRSRDHRRNIKETERGFTLLEVVITIAVVMISFLALMFSNMIIQRNNDMFYQRTVASQDAHQVMERIRDTATFGLFPNNVTDQYPDGADVPGFSNLQGQQIIVDYSSALSDPLDITITVNWLEDGFRNVSYTLSSIVTQRE